jgi:hypothetical protein
MTHQEINIEAKGNYSNIHPGRALDQDKFCLVKKKFAQGLEKQSVGKMDGKPYKFYAHNVTLVQPSGLEADVSFLLYEKDNKSFEECGGEGDLVRIWCRKDKTGTRRNPMFIQFEKV